MGVKALKEFHLKDSKCYEKDIKDKIFFIAQNAIVGNKELAQLRQFDPFDPKMNQHCKHAKLSNNTTKVLQKMHSSKASTLAYATFLKMNQLWLQYIQQLLKLRPHELKDGIISKEKYDASV